MSFEYEIFIPFHLCDPAGVLFFGHAFQLAHQAYERFVTEYLEIPWTEWFQNEQWIVPIVHTEAQYKNPILPGKNCLILLNVEASSQCSFQLRYEFFQEEKLACELKTTHVFCNRETRNKISIPEGTFSFNETQRNKGTK